MAEPVDYFMQGVGLGQRSRSIRNQEDQFRTNLAERARQANREFDLQKKQPESQIARDNLYVQKLKYALETSRTEDARNTLDLESLKQFQAELEAAKENPAAALPMPPSGLTGANLQSAINLREAHDQSRKERSSYIVFKQQEDDHLDLVMNYGRPADTANFSPQDQAALVDRAKFLRANREAMQIANDLGLPKSALMQSPKGTTMNMVEAFYNPATGRLEKEALQNELRPLSPFVVSSQQQYSTGTTVRNLTRKLTDDEKKQKRLEGALKALGSNLYIKTTDEYGEDAGEKLSQAAVQIIKSIDPNIDLGGGAGAGGGEPNDGFVPGFRASQQNSQNQNAGGYR